jgi:NADPH oxidase
MKTGCNYGRPDWKKIFNNIRVQNISFNSKRKIGVFYCGPPALAKIIDTETKNVTDNNLEFILKKEHF